MIPNQTFSHLKITVSTTVSTKANSHKRWSSVSVKRSVESSSLILPCADYLFLTQCSNPRLDHACKKPTGQSPIELRILEMFMFQFYPSLLVFLLWEPRYNVQHFTAFSVRLGVRSYGEVFN